MPTVFDRLWQEAAVVAVLMFVIWSGHKGYWYWSPGVRALAAELGRERDDWRRLAIVLLRKQGIELPEDFDRSVPIVLPGDENRTGR
jgi:hypothetical protein